MRYAANEPWDMAPTLSFQEKSTSFSYFEIVSHEIDRDDKKNTKFIL
jgi:hypothetical protein